MPNIFELSTVVLESVRQKPTNIIVDILLAILIVCGFWGIYIALFLVAVWSGLLDDPADADPEIGYDAQRAERPFEELYAQWIDMQRLRVWGVRDYRRFPISYGSMSL